MSRVEIALIGCIGLIAVVAYIKADKVFRQLNRSTFRAPTEYAI